MMPMFLPARCPGQQAIDPRDTPATPHRAQEWLVCRAQPAAGMMSSPELDEAVSPLVMVEVAPLRLRRRAASAGICSIDPNDDTGTGPFPTASANITRPSAKLQLANMSRQAMFSPGWMGGDSYNVPESQECRGGFRLRLDCDQPPSVQEGHAAIATRRRREQLVLDESKTLVAGELLFVGKKRRPTQYEREAHGSVISATYLRSDHPLVEEEVPCILTGYALASKSTYDKITCFPCTSETLSCMITSETMVRVLPEAKWEARQCGDDDPLDYFHRCLLGGVQTKPASALTGLSRHDDETVDSLSIRMSAMFSNVTWVGTRNDSKRRREKREKELEAAVAELDSYWSATMNEKDDVVNNEPLPLLLREGAMLVTNSTPNSGKTTMVASIASERLSCDTVHIVSASSLFAKYGTQADSALETMLHDVVLASAVRARSNKDCQSGKVCIILDHFESFLPLSRVGGDPYLPVLNSMGESINVRCFLFLHLVLTLLSVHPSVVLEQTVVFTEERPRVSLSFLSAVQYQRPKGSEVPPCCPAG